MSMKTPSERFLMTIPKPIHDWLSDEAEKLGVTVQDRIRVMLKEEQKRLRPPTEVEMTEIEEKCYLLGKEVYDEFAVERRRLTILQIPGDNKGGEYEKFYLEHNIDDNLVLPVIQKSFYPFLPSEANILYKYEICRAAKQVAEVENKLLAGCEDGDKVFEGLSFCCMLYFKDGVYSGCFRVCLNSERTPSFADTIRVTS